MKLNKNIFTFAMGLAIFSPITSNDSTEENMTKLTGIEESIALDVVEETATTIASNPSVQETATTAETAVTHEISTIEACETIQEFTENLTNGTKFTINNHSFVIDTMRAMNAAEESIIESIAMDVIDSAITTIANLIETTSTTHPASAITPISQQAALTLLQQFTSTLAAGNSFTLNGVNYTIQATNQN